MINEEILSKLYTIFPFRYNNRVIEMLSPETLDDYVSILLSDDYNSYIDYKFNEKFSVDSAKRMLFNRIIHYPLLEDNIGEYRLVLKNTDNNDIMGTCTLYFDKDGGMSVGYYLVCCYRGQGEAYNMMHNIIDSIILSEVPIKYIYGVVHRNNKKSLNLLKFLGFEKYALHDIESDDNVEYRRYINGT